MRVRERPVKPTYIVETPVLDPDVYLLRKQNKAFLEKKRKTPQLGNNTYIILSGAMATGSIIAVVCLVLLLVTQGMSDYRFIECFFSFVVATLIMVSRMSLDTYQAERTRGLVVPGTVIRATSALSAVGTPIAEQLNIWYRFELPEGGEKVGYTRYNNVDASSNIRPAPGTPVRVWYTEGGKSYLL